MPIIKFKDVTVKYENRIALQNVTFSVKKGEYVGLIGPNGAGKSTFLKVIVGIVKNTSGTIKINKGIKIGYVPQHFLPESNTNISVEETLEMALDRRFFWKITKGERLLISQKLKLVGLDKTFQKRNFHTLSGGQKQRVIIARSLINNPDVLLFDEPTSGVDFETKLKLYELLAKLNKENQTTIIFVSHEVEHIIDRCHRILCLNKELHEGCHPMHFAKGKTDCKMPQKQVPLNTVHHNHDLKE